MNNREIYYNKKHYFIFLLIFLFFSVQLYAMEAAEKLTLSFSNLPLSEAIKKVETASNYTFFYDVNKTNLRQQVSLNVKDADVNKAMASMLANTDLTFSITDRQIALISRQNPAQNNAVQKQIHGRVIDENGEAIIGASVAEKGTSNGTVTDIDGNFSLNINGNAVLQITFIGYHSQEIAVGAQTNLEIVLRENVQALDEVVVVGYSTQKKAHLSGAVSTISSKALESRPVSNANLALQGLAPNVNIRASNGSPMLSPEINVRGYTSINGGSALILVDNVPMSAGEFSRINPADIENVSVLKDAASAAIYGARAAYGVILVTTKTAKSNKLEINADLNYGVRQELNIYKYDFDLVNFMETINLASGDNPYSAAHIEYARQRMANPSLPEVRMPEGAVGYDPKYPTLDAENRYDYYAMTNWHDLITNKLPAMTNANISIGQRTERMNFMTSAAYFQSNGVYVGENPTKRYNIRAGGNYKLFDWWSLGANISFSRTEYDLPYIIGHQRNDETAGAPSSLSAKYIKNPPKNPDGTWTESGSEVLGQLVDGGRYISKQNQTQFAFNTQFDVIKDVFAIKGDANIRLFNANYNEWKTSVVNSRAPGRYDRANTPNVAYTGAENILTTTNLYGDFHKTFAGKHFVQALAGFNQEHLSQTTTAVWQDDMISENFPTLNLTTGAIGRNQTRQALSLRGVFGRLNYTFDNRYIVEFNGRYDGTSRYAKGHRFGFFPSITGAWITSNEKFFEPVKEALKISFLKFRGSYGSLGNQASGGYYPYFSTMKNPEIIGQYIDGNRPLGIKRPDGEAAGNLTWETVRTINFGVNLGLFKNRFNIEFDRYTRYTEGMLAPAKPISAQFGADVATTNAADLKTKGWELDLTWRDEIKDVAGSPFSYSVRFMLADARAWITKYDNPNKLITTDGYKNYTWREGQEVGEIWGFEVPGLFGSDEEALLWHDQTAMKHPRRSGWGAGDMKFNDLNHDGKIDNGKSTEDDPGDRRVIGNDQIRLPYSMDLSAGWKGFDLRVFFQGVGKRDWYPATTVWDVNNGNQEFWSSYQGPWRTPSIYIRDYWTPETPDGYYPRRFPQFGQESGVYEWGVNNTRYLQDASYLRLKNLTLGYTLSNDLTSKWGIGRLRVYLSGENLWTLSHIHVDAIDPETLGKGYTMYPMQRVYSLGFNINF